MSSATLGTDSMKRCGKVLRATLCDAAALACGPGGHHHFGRRRSSRPKSRSGPSMPSRSGRCWASSYRIARAMWPSVHPARTPSGAAVVSISSTSNVAERASRCTEALVGRPRQRGSNVRIPPSAIPSPIPRARARMSAKANIATMRMAGQSISRTRGGSIALRASIVHFWLTHCSNFSPSPQ